MKYIFLLSILSMFSFNIFSQNLTVDCQLESGSLSNFYKKIGTSIIGVNSSGEILEILLFDSETSANIYMKKPNEVNKPNENISIAGIQIYLNFFASIGYYSPNEYHSGKIKNIGNILIDYYTPNEYNSGKLKTIGDISISYYSPNEYHSGKIKDIGHILIDYYTPNEHNPGKLKTIGDISISYYSPNEYHSGKIKSIGNILIDYYTPNEYNSGKFKEIKQTDSRVRLL